ncbi:unnamed protein product [Auanema sp. JU1783]|nr:unnamed protein product [Auanema sp. JU1783]
MISDDTSDDESSQIRGLEEDQGIYHHQEVVVSPQYESDDDNLQVERDHRRSPTGMVSNMNSNSRSVHFTGDYSDDEPSNESDRRIIQKLENPHSADVSDDELNPLNHLAGSHTGDYPPNSPPAYSSPRDADKTRSNINSPPPRPSISGNGALNEMMAKVTQPFTAIIRGGQPADQSDDDYDTELTGEEVQVLEMIHDFRPEHIEVRPVLKAFIPDFIPAIGDIDAFIKIPRPDEVEDNIGLTQLDEPSVKQSDPTILGMQMRNATKEVTTQDDMPAKQLERADKNTEEIDKWISNIKELHKMRPAQTVHYKGPMPDIERLMQEWNPVIEQSLNNMKLPTAELAVDLKEFIDICLNIVDIPLSRFITNCTATFSSITSTSISVTPGPFMDLSYSFLTFSAIFVLSGTVPIHHRKRSFSSENTDSRSPSCEVLCQAQWKSDFQVTFQKIFDHSYFESPLDPTVLSSKKSLNEFCSITHQKYRCLKNDCNIKTLEWTPDKFICVDKLKRFQENNRCLSRTSAVIRKDCNHVCANVETGLSKKEKDYVKAKKLTKAMLAHHESQNRFCQVISCHQICHERVIGHLCEDRDKKSAQQLVTEYYEAIFSRDWAGREDTRTENLYSSFCRRLTKGLNENEFISNMSDYNTKILDKIGSEVTRMLKDIKL